MPETAVSPEPRAAPANAFSSRLLQDCYNFHQLGEWQERARRHDWHGRAAIGEEAVTNNFGLLLKPVAIEWPARHKVVAVPAERVAHQR